MKRIVTAIVGSALLALPAFAGVGINPCDPGLPQDWNSSVYVGVTIGDTAVPSVPTDCSGSNGARLSVIDSYSSAFCVECHGLNPSSLITDPTGPFATMAKVGSHVVMSINGSTNSGGGFTGGTVVDATGTARPVIRITGEYERTAYWTPGGVAAKGLSKYGSTAATYQNNEIISTTTDSTAGDLICESCHNVLVNNGDQLTLGGYMNDGVNDLNGNQGDAICLGCHSTDGTYAGFHNNGNLPNFDKSYAKRHHVLRNLAGTEIDALPGEYNNDNDTLTNDSRMWAPSYTRELGGAVRPANDPFAFAKGLSATGQGALDAPDPAGDITTGTALMCVSCHRPHNAESTAGAFILRSGDGNTFSGWASGAGPVSGIQTQEEYGSWASNKIYGEYAILCSGCHTGY